MVNDPIERPLNIDSLHLHEDLWPNLHLSISEDRLKVLLECTMADIERDGFGEEIVKRLKAMGVAKILDPLAVLQIVAEKFPRGAQSGQLVLLEGTPPEPPVDASIEWQGNFFAPGYVIDPTTKRIDFRQKASQPTVVKDQILVIVHPAIEGTPGLDVKGHKITVPSARRCPLRPGTNVYWSEPDSAFRSRTEGRVKQVGQTLDVDEVLHIKDGVGIVSGNVEHRGQVIVGGDVESEFKVTATGNIEVRGVIRAADITCGGNLVAVEGINSSLEKKIRVTGDIITKYIINASVVCDGNITANGEIYQCRVKTRGEVVCKSGRIIGGEIIATKAIEAGEAGSRADTKTVLIAGLDYAQYEKLDECKRKIQNIREAARILKDAKRRLDQIKMILSPEKKILLAEITDTMNEYLELEKAETEEAQKLNRQIVLNRSACIKIAGIVYPGVVFKLYDSSFVVQHPLQGPLKAQIDPVTHKIALVSDD
jgi:uncharacterized protein (DUF342 family)